ncbi:MAG: nucleotide sugar dehydrogenase [Betaproteobacteria bacterium]|nr:nucleotide sugar dehydrogenase [Betaproteobacteria bacterium]
MSTFKQQLLSRFASKQAVVGIIGLGYVGLPLALRFSQAGFQTLGFDIDAQKVAALHAGKTYLQTVAAGRVASALRNGFSATTDFARAAEADALIICVPTPLTASREPDLSFVIGTIESLLAHLRAGQLICLESTTYPGTTEEELMPRIASRGFTIGEDMFLVYSPEREDPGNPQFNTQTIPKICGGVTKACLEAGLALYGQAIDVVVPVSSTRVAEMTKLLENIHRCVNIGLVNEMKIVADRMGIDIHEVIRAAATKPFGFVPYTPGPGLGGHCIPIDPFYLTWKARQYGVNTRFIELAGEVNSAMPAWVVDKVAGALNDRSKPVRGSKILILGLAYKKNIDDVRESPAAQIMELLRERGAILAYADPHVPVFPKMREHLFDLASVALDASTLENYDCAIVVTDHDAFDYDLIARHAALVVDTRGRYQAPLANVVKA